MHKSKQYSTKTLKINNKILIGFKYDDVYSSKQLFKIIELSTTIGGLIYFNKSNLTPSILNLI
jgi:hypothetical protein